MEGLAHGKLCIATAESGADDILTSGQDGFLVPGGSVNALADALIEAIGLDASRRREMISMARRTARQFDWEAVARQHYGFLFESLKPRSETS